MFDASGKRISLTHSIDTDYLKIREIEADYTDPLTNEFKYPHHFMISMDGVNASAHYSRPEELSTTLLGVR